MSDEPEAIDVLFVEDNPGDVTLIKRHLRDGGGVLARSTVTHVESLPDALDRLASERFDVVLLDLGLPGSSGIDTLERLQDRFESDDELTPVAVVVLTGLDDDEVAVGAIQHGAQDYLVKGNIDANVLQRTVRYAVERHQQERELRRQNERLDQFASVVSHDLRNPLSIAMGHLELYQQTDDPDAVETAADALERMDDLIDDLLTLAREGRSVDDPQPVDLSSVVRECWSTVDTAEMDLTVETSQTGPADDDATALVDGNAAVLADESRLQQLFENLVRNAREHAGEDVTVTVGLLETGTGFYVEDDGPGVPEDERDSVFEPGYTSRENGTGFGLNIVREVAQAHGWTVTVTGGRDGGARFEFRGVEMA